MNAAANKATTTNKTNKKYERQETLRLDHGRETRIIGGISLME